MNNSILRGAQEALDHASSKSKISFARKTRIKIPESIDVHAIRERLHLSRKEFCNSFGFNQRTVEKWEQGTRTPEGAARAYLTVIDIHPEMVKTALVHNQNPSAHSS